MRAAKPLLVAATSASVQVITGRGKLLGLGLRESTGAATAKVDVCDGDHVAQRLLVPMDFGDGAAGSQPIPPHGIEFEQGLYLHVLSGSVYGTLWVELDWDNASAPGSVHGDIDIDLRVNA